eukprot:s4570_g11.t1
MPERKTCSFARLHAADQHPSASSLHQEAEEPQAPLEEDAAEGKKKRRRRRRGKRKGRGSKDAQERGSLGKEADVLTSQSRQASTPQPTEAEVQVQQHAVAETLQAAAPGSPRLEALHTVSTRTS